MTYEKYENVKYMIQVYFDQDWDVVAKTDKEAIGLLCERMSPAEISEISNEITHILLDFFGDIEDVDKMLKDFKCGYAYRRLNDMNGIDWLLRLQLFLTPKN